jgi:hypothetical protein
MTAICAKIVAAHTNYANPLNGFFHSLKCCDFRSFDIHFQKVDAIDPLLVTKLI